MILNTRTFFFLAMTWRFGQALPILQFFFINTNVYLYAGISSYYNYLLSMIKLFFSIAASLKKYTKKKKYM